mmetsp:Transcript_78553/g.235477  ORF Transcript_78553/g.235477 Transcript_78553/m.235477 type:complete len:127 (-) Transcript_78553:175-555(-)|eukprot:4315839-Prymnesium_polylepis.2
MKARALGASEHRPKPFIGWVLPAASLFSTLLDHRVYRIQSALCLMTMSERRGDCGAPPLCSDKWRSGVHPLMPEVMCVALGRMPERVVSTFGCCASCAFPGFTSPQVRIGAACPWEVAHIVTCGLP